MSRREDGGGDTASALDAASVPRVHRVPAGSSLASEELRGLKEVWTGRSLQAVPSRQHAVPFVTCTGAAVLCPPAEARSRFCLDNARVDRRGLCGSRPFVEGKSACTVQSRGDNHRPHQALQEAWGRSVQGGPGGVPERGAGQAAGRARSRLTSAAAAAVPEGTVLREGRRRVAGWRHTGDCPVRGGWAAPCCSWRRPHGGLRGHRPRQADGGCSGHAGQRLTGFSAHKREFSRISPATYLPFAVVPFLVEGRSG